METILRSNVNPKSIQILKIVGTYCFQLNIAADLLILNLNMIRNTFIQRSDTCNLFRDMPGKFDLLYGALTINWHQSNKSMCFLPLMVSCNFIYCWNCWNSGYSGQFQPKGWHSMVNRNWFFSSAVNSWKGAQFSTHHICKLNQWLVM
jgi:hypothetical protein